MMHAALNVTRREWLFAAGAFASLAAATQSFSQDLLNNCEECAGIGFLPLKNRKPYYHIEGQPSPKPADAVPYRFCPKCQPDKMEQELVDEQTKRFQSALDAHKKWERETGFQLTRIETRHITVHSQMPSHENKEIGLAFENYAAHVQNLVGTMELTRTLPQNYEMMCLLNEPPYQHFRATMEKIYTREQLGDKWSVSRGMMAFDHFLIPFFYENQATIKQRPPAHGVAFMGGRKQLSLQTNYRSPTWLSEGYAEYSEYIALKKNLWRTVYNANPGPEPGDWVGQVRQLATGKQLRPWEEQMKRELQDWDSRDYLQTFGMVTFLIQSEPKKFLGFTRRLRGGADPTTALEEAYGKKLDELETTGNKWIAAGGK